MVRFLRIRRPQRPMLQPRRIRWGWNPERQNGDTFIPSAAWVFAPVSAETEAVAPALPRWLLPRRMVVKGKSAGRKRGLPPAISAISGTGNELQPMGRLASLNEKGNSYPVPEITRARLLPGEGDQFRGQISGTGNELQPMGRLASLNEVGNSYPVPEITRNYAGSPPPR
jgi:hypothetical protein